MKLMQHFFKERNDCNNQKNRFVLDTLFFEDGRMGNRIIIFGEVVKHDFKCNKKMKIKKKIVFENILKQWYHPRESSALISI